MRYRRRRCRVSGFRGSGKIWAQVSPVATDWRCEESGEQENLWLNLSTGYIGSGRQVGACTDGAGLGGTLRCRAKPR